MLFPEPGGPVIRILEFDGTGSFNKPVIVKDIFLTVYFFEGRGLNQDEGPDFYLCLIRDLSFTKYKSAQTSLTLRKGALNHMVKRSH